MSKIGQYVMEQAYLEHEIESGIQDDPETEETNEEE
jgi:hypothetical protein